MSTATLPDGTITRNFAVFYDSLDTNGPGVLQWNGVHGSNGRPLYSVRFTSASQAGDAWRFDFEGEASIQGYDDGAPLPSLLPKNKHHWV